ncbi:MAG: O-antigen ligase family protein [Betaproteobacteria bacterium]
MALLTRFFDGFVDPKALSFGLPAKPVVSGKRLAETPLEWAVLLALLMAPVVYLSVRHGIHACLYLLVALAAYQFVKYPDLYRRDMSEPWVGPLMLAFAGLFLATAITQIAGQNFHLASFDSPSKILLGGAVFLFLRRRSISFVRTLEWSLPAGLLLTRMIIWLYPGAIANWDGIRYATSFVDPNSLGSQSLILTMLCLFSIGLFGKERPLLLLLKIAGVVVGLEIAIHAGSRGAWMAMPPMLVLWVVLYFCRTKETGFARYFVPLSLFTIAILGMSLGYDAIGTSRGTSAFEALCDWATGRNLEGPVGLRLSIWKISFALAQDSPWIGYGKTNFSLLLANYPENIPALRSAIDTLSFAGPHSDILAKQLSMGLIGLFAYFATLLVPALYFWRHRRDADVDRHVAAHLGMYFVAGIFVCGLSNEMLSLKYLCSFFALMVAGLAADVARRGR